MPVNNPNPTTSRAENYAKYAEYFEKSDKNTNLSIETFFQLLMAEMQNQDPLEPTSNTEFISQLANFTSLQNTSNTLYYNTVSYAASLAGKTVTVATATADGKGLKVQTGVVTDIDISDSKNIEIVVNGKRYSLGSVMNVASSDSSSRTSSSDGAYAVSLIGKKVTMLAKTEEGTTVLDEGIVSNIEVENGVYRVVVNGLSYTLDAIVRVYNADSTESGGMASAPGSTETKPSEDEEPEDGETAETSLMEDNEDLKKLFS